MAEDANERLQRGQERPVPVGNSFTCPIPRCSRQFKRENLLFMHMAKLHGGQTRLDRYKLNERTGEVFYITQEVGSLPSESAMDQYQVSTNQGMEPDETRRPESALTSPIQFSGEMWTGIRCDLVRVKAIELKGYNFEKYGAFYYVRGYLRGVSLFCLPTFPPRKLSCHDPRYIDDGSTFRRIYRHSSTAQRISRQDAWIYSLQTMFVRHRHHQDSLLLPLPLFLQHHRVHPRFQHILKSPWACNQTGKVIAASLRKARSVGSGKARSTARLDRKMNLMSRRQQNSSLSPQCDLLCRHQRRGQLNTITRSWISSCTSRYHGLTSIGKPWIKKVCSMSLSRTIGIFYIL